MEKEKPVIPIFNHSGQFGDSPFSAFANINLMNLRQGDVPSLKELGNTTTLGMNYNSKYADAGYSKNLGAGGTTKQHLNLKLPVGNNINVSKSTSTMDVNGMRSRLNAIKASGNFGNWSGNVGKATSSNGQKSYGGELSYTITPNLTAAYRNNNGSHGAYLNYNKKFDY